MQNELDLVTMLKQSRQT